MPSRPAPAPSRAPSPIPIVIPPPNVTGSLHMGHALNNTLQDILVRFERMRGSDVLWQPGMDHAGIATQMVVERQMMERQEPNRRAIGREKFVEKVWAWKAESGGVILNQLKRLGASCDWSRERFTMDEGLSRAVLKVFVDLYRDGLIYKDKRLVNWDPKLQTAISDLEVERHRDCRAISGTSAIRWRMASPMSIPTCSARMARSAIGNRPTGRLRATKHATSSSSPRRGPRRCSAIPASRSIPTTRATRTWSASTRSCRWSVAASRSSPTNIPIPRSGTGAVKITPAHDFNDFEVGKRHDLPAINILDARKPRSIILGQRGLPAPASRKRRRA